MHESRGPLVFVAAVDTLESLFHVAGIKSDQWILSHFGPADGLHFDLVDGALAPLLFLPGGSLSEGTAGNEGEQY